nr:TPM domain-containing protein [uncultured Desulfuromonas sp.]
MSGCQRAPSDVAVVDQALLLSPQAVKRIDSLAHSMLAHNRVQLQVVILKDPAADLDAAALRWMEEHRLGELAGGARGVLLMVDPTAEQVRVEIGYDLEGVFSDVIVARIEQEQMVPFFAANRVGDGIEASLELLVAEQPEEEPLAHSVGSRYSGGAGAVSQVPINKPFSAEFSDPMSKAARSRFVPQPTPLAALECYRQVLEEHVKDAELRLYTPATREFFASWLVTDGQQNHERNALEQALPHAQVVVQEPLAVVRFAADQRQWSPYFFEHGDDGWQLDFSTMSRVIGFNQRNQWFFRTRNHPFMFAFGDWTFDGNGYPKR